MEFDLCRDRFRSLKFVSNRIQIFPGIRDNTKETFKLFTGIVVAVCTVYSLLFFSAFSYLTDAAVTKMTVTIRCAAKTVNIRRFYIAVVLFRPESGYLCSLFIVIIPCCNECIALVT